ncbi:MAG TPA: hypothetical protein VGE09_12140 [Pseudoxanthomonas sp.]
MRLNTLMLCAFVTLQIPSVHAQSKPDPLFGDDPHAKAVLDCHADYARRFARSLTPVKGTPTEVATAAYAGCSGEFEAFSKAMRASAETSKDPKAFMDPGGFQREQVAKLREYAFAYTLDLYLRNTTTF